MNTNSRKQCPLEHEHRTPNTAELDYSLPFCEPEWLPCHLCRPKDFKRERIARMTRQRGH
ncbi:MAG TPA: hypothetical protein PKO33_09270 [Pyrinomonadaceae bacterium]|nr:hypothetical protein [Pyrinomonadaceae bacterium]